MIFETRTLVRLASALALSAGALVAGGCSDDSDLPDPVRPTQDFGRVRFVNAARDPARTTAALLAADVQVEGTPFAVNVAYGAGVPQVGAGSSPAVFYYPVYVGSRQLTSQRTRDPLSTDPVVNVLTQQLTVAANTDYTVLAVGAAPAIEGVVITDDNTAPAAGQVKLRVINAAPTLAAVDVYITPTTATLPALTTLTPTFTNVAYKAASGYASLAAGNYTVRLTTAGTKNSVAPAAGVATGALTAGAIRTIVAVTPVAGTANTATLTVLSDR